MSEYYKKYIKYKNKYINLQTQMGGVLGDELRDDANFVSISTDEYADLLSWKTLVPIRNGAKFVLDTSDKGDIDSRRESLKKSLAQGNSTKMVSIHKDEYDELRAGMKSVPIRNGAKWVPIPADELRDEPPPVVRDEPPPVVRAGMKFVPIRNGAKWVPIPDDELRDEPQPVVREGMKLVPIRNGAKWVPISDDELRDEPQPVVREGMKLVPIRNGAKWVPISDDELRDEPPPM